MDHQNNLEHDVLQKLLEGNDPILWALRLQVPHIATRRKSATGVGFFVEFTMSAAAVPLAGSPSFSFGDVIAEMDELGNGAGFILFVDSGLLAMLEGYSFGEAWPATIGAYRLRYNKCDERDMAALRASHGWPWLQTGD